MADVKVIRANYEDMCKRYAESAYRREREYGAYLDRFLHSDGVVDGMAATDRADKLPLSYNRYFS